MVYFNDKGDFYIDNKYMFGDEDFLEVILKECMCEFMFEGKCWYDLRLFGVDYVIKCILVVVICLLWLINESVLIDNLVLK